MSRRQGVTPAAPGFLQNVINVLALPPRCIDSRSEHRQTTVGDAEVAELILPEILTSRKFGVSNSENQGISSSEKYSGGCNPNFCSRGKVGLEFLWRSFWAEQNASRTVKFD